jgi:peptidoglycan hydrolase-like protein with peptidoglycan-binding domain
MSKWKSVLTLTVAAAMVATTAFAQSGAGAPGTPPPTSETTTPDSTSPSASPSTSTDKPVTSTDKAPDSMKPEKKSRMPSAGTGDRERVKAVQQALKDKGYDPGAVDGVMGPRTRAALKDFQKKEGVKDTGRLDQETLAKLGVEGQTSGTSASPPTISSPSTDSSPGSSSAPGSGSSPSDSTAPGKK